MKVPVSDIKTESSGVLKSLQFGVGDVRVIFNILRKHLYTDPILAVVREYISNARDAHREVGTPDLPIEIYLPNAFSREFKVKDYGPGISPERVDNIFRNYAASTKRNDNTQTGWMGIGSKSYVSYTDSISVETIYNHIKYTYVVYLDESEIGKIDLLSQIDTDEPNGTTIIIPVNKNDDRTFREKLVNITQFWEPRPIIFGGECEYKKYTKLYTQDDWWIPVDNGSYSYYRTGLAVIDGIQYNIDSNSLKGIKKNQLAILNCGPILKFGIGELSLAASRDVIQYDDKTVNLILNRLSILDNSIKDLINNDISKSASYAEASSLLEKTKETFRNIDSSFFANFTFNGVKLHTELPTTTLGTWARAPLYSKDGLGNIAIINYSYNNKFKRKHIIFKDSNVVMFLNDKTDNNLSKHILEHLFTLYPGKYIQIICTPSSPNSNKYDPTSDAIPVYNWELIKQLNLISIKDIKFPPQVKVVQNNTKTKSLDKIKGYKIINPSYKYFKVESIDLSKTVGGIYVTVDYMKKDITSGNLFISDNYKLSTYSELLEQEIVGFSKARTEEIKKYPQWIPLEKALKDKASLLSSEVKEIERVISDNSYNSNTEIPSSIMIELLQCLNQDHIILEWKLKSDICSEFIKENKENIGFLADLGFISTEIIDIHNGYKYAPKSELKDLRDKIYLKYPLLEELKNKNSVIGYIKLVDDYNKLTEKFNKLNNKEEQEYVF